MVDLEKLVFLDLETAGLAVTRPIIQIAAVAVDSQLAEQESFEARILFDEADARLQRARRHHAPKSRFTQVSIDLQVATQRRS
jgi:hypothetical protein